MERLNERQGWCILNGVTERTACETCAFRNVQCEFFCETRADGENKLKSKDWSKSRSMDATKNRLAKYNAIEREKDKLLKIQRQQEQKKADNIDKNIKKEGNRNTLMRLLILTAIILIIAFPAAYLFVLCQIFTEMICELFKGNIDLITNEWYFSSYWTRYIYCVLLGCSAIGLYTHNNESTKNKVSESYTCCAIGLYIPVAIVNINLLISTIIGPICIAFGLWLNYINDRKR